MKKLPVWRKILAAVSGAASLVLIAQAIRVTDLTKLIDANGMTALAGGQLKLYGILLGKTNEAERVFADAEQRIAPLADNAPTGKTVAFFAITSNNLATVRKGSDYVARMIEMAGGSYVFADLTDNGNSLATMNLPLEDFYAGA